MEKKNNSTQELSTLKYTEREDLIHGTKRDEQFNLQHFNYENQNLKVLNFFVHCVLLWAQRASLLVHVLIVSGFNVRCGKKSKTCHYLRVYWDDASQHIEMPWKPRLFNTSAYSSAAEPRWHNHCFFCLPHRTTITKEGNSKVHFKKPSKQRALLTDVLCFNMFS